MPPRGAGKTAGGRRIRFGPLPRPPEQIEVPYARGREELKGLSCGELTEIVLGTQAFKDEIGRICDKLDEARRGQRGPAPSYSAWECEAVFVYQRVCGLRSVREARDRLAGDRGADARRVLGLDRSRRGLSGDRPQKLRPGIPSEATLSRHAKRFGERRRRGAYERLFKHLVRDHLTQFPEMQEEARILTIDGSKLETHYTAPIVDPKSGEIVNSEEMTAPEAGYRPWSLGPDKGGHGWASLSPVTLQGLPMATSLIPLNRSEPIAAIELFKRDFARDVRPHLDPGTRMVVADGAFHSHELRRELRQLGMVEQIHHVSHGDSEKSRRNARRADKLRFEIEGYPNWQANGHYELLCNCGHGKVAKRISIGRQDEAVIRSEGTCHTCGSITITAGRWRKAKNPNRFVRCMPHEMDQADQAFGNPLTYNDPMAEIYGNKRFAHNEGFHGQVTSRFNLFKHKRWFRRTDQARTDVAIIFSIIHSLAMEQRRRKATGTHNVTSAAGRQVGPGPPPAAAA